MSVMEQNNTRPRSKSSISFKSDKSRKHEKESAYDKRKSHLTATTKANPNAAMEEAQPIAAALEKPTLQSLRSFQHTDVHGNPIAEPDLSNPTRSRWERPLDTIKSFQAQIDNQYKRKPESPNEPISGYGSRRSSYYGGHEQPRDRYSQGGGYYGGRQQQPPPRDTWAENGHGGMGHPRSRYNPRPQAEPMPNRYNNGHGVYPTQGYQQSRDTINTGGSNGSSEPYLTDPNSENSSIERAPVPPRHQELGEQYGFTGFGGGPQLHEERGYPNGAGYDRGEEYRSSGGAYQQPYQQQTHQTGAPAVLTTSNPSNGGNVIKLGAGQQQSSSRGTPQQAQAMSGGENDKRKSWFKKRFSKG